ncbi:Zn-ribbon domain-containing OB-fold protein [candidate division WOR-3 bacterium]|nr:Zn-ribbon domain-containing OB-fold protein [candidate division WOR-3 bacterium]
MALKQRNEQVSQTKVWFGELPVESLYTVGIAGERFYRTLQEKGQLTGTKCERCGIVFVPGRIFCERCLERLDNWVTVGPTGTLESWTVVYVGLDGKRLKQPVLVGLIKLDGASTCLVHYLGNVKPEEICFGMRVAPVLKPKAKREGAITDILYFQPAP